MSLCCICGQLDGVQRLLQIVSGRVRMHAFKILDCMCLAGRFCVNIAKTHRSTFFVHQSPRSSLRAWVLAAAVAEWNLTSYTSCAAPLPSHVSCDQAEAQALTP
eukprot:359219-Chlamydomonas_euryale.AAC.13